MSLSRGHVGLFGALALVVVTGGLLYRPSFSVASKAPPAVSANASLQAEVRALRREVRSLAGLNREVSALRSAVRERHEPVPEGVTDKSAPIATDHRIQAAREESAIKETLNGAFVSDVRDGAWAGVQETRWKESFSRGLSSNRVKSVECKSTLCRVELEQTSPNAEDELNQHMTQSQLKEEAYGHRTDDGRFYVYLAREGHGLPQPDLSSLR